MLHITVICDLYVLLVPVYGSRCGKSVKAEQQTRTEQGNVWLSSAAENTFIVQE